MTHATAVSYDAANREIRPFETSGQLTALLQGLPGLTNLVVTAAAVEDEIRFRLQFDKAVQRTYPLALGVAAQVDLPVTGNVAVNLATHVDLTFGVNQQNTFFVLETAGPQFAVSGTASADLDLATRLGFLGVTITNGTVSLPTAMAVRLQDPDTDSPATSGRITSGELLIANGLSLIAPSVSGTAEAQLPLSTDLFPDTATLRVTWATRWPRPFSR